MNKKIRVIVPIATSQYNGEVLREVEYVLAPDFEADYVNLNQGTCFIESRYAEHLNTDEIIRLTKDAQSEGVDGVFVDCFASPGVDIARELVDIPVIGGFDAAVLMASSIAHRFAIITVMPSVEPMLLSEARKLGVIDNLAAINNVGIPVEALSDRNSLVDGLIEQSKKAIKDQGAKAIVLGCTGMVDVFETVATELKQMGIPAPVINPTHAAICSLQSLIRCGLSHSRLTYHRSNASFVSQSVETE